MQIGMQRETAEESIYREKCLLVNDGLSWAKYMSISGSSEDEYDIIALQYTEDGLLSVDENREGHAAAFGDDIAVQAHGSDGMVEEENCVFFLPHKPRNEIIESPLFLFIKGTVEIETLQKQRSEFYEELRAKTEDILQMQDKINEASADTVALTEQINTLQHELDSLQMKKSETESELDRVKQEKSDFTNHIIDVIKHHYSKKLLTIRWERNTNRSTNS
ncbi:unnamed protein product [Eruca vesicaria subsp. sativa]|uniref:Uncharacterized protein n=1 Tax=Eruca vesicaria subsp. sativa TaxID=29727 RepID=A0ABC8KBQ0_ERUVS|nr:unnamed protein product [Eruca vesicaria subsp. sativa]